MYNKLLLYTAVLRPILTYGSPVWGYAADSNIKILEVAQNSLIRNIVKADRYTRNIKIYEDIKILPFKAYIQKLAISFFNNLPNINNENVKMLNNYIPVPDLKRPRRILLDSVPLTNHSSAIQTQQDIPAETVSKNNSVPVTTPPCHARSTNQDSLYQAGPTTSGYIYKLDMGWRNASRSVSQRRPALID
ncbi:putative RNA-directed DNA polymerase from transposon X-element [Trichonephila clavipes]|nr:putative RNA-directed DNA polymerase from transposon X-element [Trichonephila clavipes]